MSKYSSDSIKIKYKYYMFKLNKEKNKIILISKANSKKEINEKINEKIKNTLENYIILIKLEKTKWTPTTKIPANMLSGPIKVYFSFYTIDIKKKIRHNKEDPRTVQFLFYTYDYYLKHKIKIDDLKKLSKLAFANKLEKRLLAPKLITQILI
jgi:hypothetical protein